MARAGKGAAQGRLRIIGGTWRGRKLRFVPVDGLRPTPDRIRETLFNWLAPHIHGARCADLFAGSGALGLEALSRGAAHCDFVDSAQRTIAQIEQHLGELQAQARAACFNQSAVSFLQQAEGPYDLLFLDPPFREQLVDETCAELQRPGLVAQDAFLYVETGADQAAPTLSDTWRPHREKISGGVAYRLYQRTD